MSEGGDWTLTYEGFEPEEEGLREALCTLGNGYFATRGAAPEAEADDFHYPGTYMAGAYNRVTAEIDGGTVDQEDLVNLPNWLPLTFRIEGGEWFDLRRVEVLSYRQELDLKRGLLTRVLRFRDDQGRRSRLTDRRFVHLRRPHLAALQRTLVAENWSGRIEVRSALDGRVMNAGVESYQPRRTRHLDPVDAGPIEPEGIGLTMRTNQSRIEIAMAARTRLALDGRPLPAGGQVAAEPSFVAHEFSVDLPVAGVLTVEKVVAVHSSRDRAISESGLAAREAIAEAGGFDALVEEHVLAWEQFWRRCDVRIEDGVDAQRTLRLHVFHLLQTASTNTVDLDAGVPARGWTGEAYRGHIFWDELFVLPFLNLRLPAVARSLLLYRYRRLPAARRAAQEEGYAGAMYPWQSGSSGREETPPIYHNPRTNGPIRDHTRLQRHIGAAIAFNVWQYYQSTGDAEFLSQFGAEMILEIARFWSSIAAYSEELGRFEIDRVIGPDEFHSGYPDAERPGLRNNTYTNVMAVWVLCRALEVLDLLPEMRRQELCESLDLGREEIERWDAISRTMRVAFLEGGVLAQFEGYDRLEELDWEGYRERYGDIQRLDFILDAEGDTPNRYKVSKQPDVLMLFYLLPTEELRSIFDRLGYSLDDEMIGRTIDHYLARTSHGSTLSRVVHAWVLSRRDQKSSWQWFREALSSDVADVQDGSTSEGIHLGAMAGTVDMIQRAYTGLEMRGDVLRFDPCLPDELTSVSTHLYYRWCRLDVEITRSRLRARVHPDAPRPVGLALPGREDLVAPGDVRDFPLEARPGKGITGAPG